MNLLEIADLTELLRKRLNIEAPAPGAFMPGAMEGLPSCMHVASALRSHHSAAVYAEGLLCVGKLAATWPAFAGQHGLNITSLGALSL